jgi:hypothetical protein
MLQKGLDLQNAERIPTVASVGEVGLRKRRPRPPTLKTFGVRTVSVSQEDPSLQEH